MKIKKLAGFIFAMVATLTIAGCGGSQNEESSVEDVEISEVTELPENGIISADSLKSIVGQNKDFRFVGRDKDNNIEYTWIYNGKAVVNPQEQRLKLTFSKEDEGLLKMVDEGVYVLGVSFEKMNMAAPARLEISINEEIAGEDFGLYKETGDKLSKINPIEATVENGKTLLKFKVTEIGQKFYIISTNKKSEDESKEDKKDEKSNKNDDSNNSVDSSDKSSGSGNGSDKAANKASNGNTSKPKDNSGSKKENGNTTPAPSGGPSSSGEEKNTVTISIQCLTILDNMGDLSAGKEPFVPSDGWIIYPEEVEFIEGDTVFEILKKVTEKHGVLMESSWTPMYDSYYVEGINNLYEFDCGSGSGWMYKVDGWYPNYGCSSYVVSPGEVIEWVYTCNLGMDIGGGMF